MSIKKNVLFVLCGLIFLLSSGGVVANGEEPRNSSMSIVIHKLILSDEGTAPIANAGQELTADQLPASIGLNNVEFTLYDITTQLNDKLDKGVSLVQAQEELINEQQGYQLDNLTSIGTAVTQTMRGEDGIAIFDLDESNEPTAYLLVESKTPSTVKTEADNTVIIHPSYDVAGQPLNELHIYPKSILKDPPPIVESTEPTDTTDQSRETVDPSTPSIENGNSKAVFPKTNEQLQSGLTLAGSLLLLLSIGVFMKKRVKMNNTK